MSTHSDLQLEAILEELHLIHSALDTLTGLVALGQIRGAS